MSNKCYFNSVIKAVLFLLAFIVLAFTCVMLGEKIKKNTPYAILLQGGFFDITPQKAVHLKTNIDVHIEERAILFAPLRSGEEVRVIATTSKAANNLEMVWGGFYPENAVREQKPYAVISDKLFAKLFAGYGASEYTVSINENEYNVIGVYYSQKSFFSDISSDGLENVYTSRPLTFNSTPTRIFLYGNESVQELITDFSKEIQAAVNEKTYDMRIVHQLSNTIISIMIFMCVACLLYNCLKKSHSIFMKCYVGANEASAKKLVLQIIQAVSIMAFVCLIFWLMLSKISFPSSLLPSDNIFDIAHYQKLLTEFYQGLNANNSYPALKIAASLLWLQLACASLCVVMFYLFIEFNKNSFRCAIKEKSC